MNLTRDLDPLPERQSQDSHIPLSSPTQSLSHHLCFIYTLVHMFVLHHSNAAIHIAGDWPGARTNAASGYVSAVWTTAIYPNAVPALSVFNRPIALQEDCHIHLTGTIPADARILVNSRFLPWHFLISSFLVNLVSQE